MIYRTLGRTGLRVSVVGFGAIKLPHIDYETAENSLRRAVELGINFFDTARNYKDSEEKIGKALGDLRDKFYIATKSSQRCADYLRRDLETSLNELRFEKIDLYQLHSVSSVGDWQSVTSKGGALEAVLKARSDGLIDHIGITIHRDITVMKEAITSEEFETIMLAYSILDQENVEKEILPLARQHNMGVVVMKPFSGGLLTSPGAEPGKPLPDDPLVLGNLRYILSNKAVQSVIPGIMSPAEVEENVKVVRDLSPLTEDHKEQLLKLIGQQRKEFRYGQVCLRCGYCLPACEQGIPIPDVFRAVDAYRNYPDDAKAVGKILYNSLDPKPDVCTECGECKKRCPAGIDIPNGLKTALDLFG